MNTDISTARAGHFINDNRRWFLATTNPTRLEGVPERWGFYGYNSDGAHAYWTAYAPIAEVTDQAPGVFKASALRRKAEKARQRINEQHTAIKRAEELAALLAEREYAARNA